MKILIYIVSATFLFPSCRSASQEAWVAEVGATKISRQALIENLKQEQDNFDPELWQDPEGFQVLKKQVLQGMIEQQVLINEAKRRSLSIPETVLDESLQELQSGYPSSDFEEHLKKRGLTSDQWRELQRNKLLVERLIENEVYSKIPISDQEIKFYYQGHRKEFYDPDQVHCQHIVTNKQEKSIKILALLDKGESFTALAQKFSESPDRVNGGDLGLIKRGEYPVVFNVCFELATGQISSIITSDYGFHIFHLIEKRPAHSLPLSEVRSRIKKGLVTSKGQQNLKTWLDDLFKTAKIRVREDVLKEIHGNNDKKS